MKALILCHGNINRSPAGEIILKTMKPEWEVKSAGLGPNAGGKITAKKMREALNDKGYPTEGIRSQKCTQELLDWADVVFYMDSSNANKLFLGGTYNIHSNKTVHLGRLLGISGIPDPAFTKDMELHKHVIDLLKAAFEVFINDRNQSGKV